MTTYRYRLNVSQDLHPISSCLQNNRLLRGFLPPGEHNLVKREEGTARSCSDPLSFASFLAFALAVANLMMGNGRRRKRSSSENFCIDRDLKEDLIMSTSTIVTGVVFSFDQSRESCRERILCDTGRQLRHYGEVGQLMADATDLLSDEVHDTIKVREVEIQDVKIVMLSLD